MGFSWIISMFLNLINVVLVLIKVLARMDCYNKPNIVLFYEYKN